MIFRWNTWTPKFINSNMKASQHPSRVTKRKVGKHCPFKVRSRKNQLQMCISPQRLQKRRMERTWSTINLMVRIKSARVIKPNVRPVNSTISIRILHLLFQVSDKRGFARIKRENEKNKWIKSQATRRYRFKFLKQTFQLGN